MAVGLELDVLKVLSKPNHSMILTLIKYKLQAVPLHVVFIQIFSSKHLEKRLFHSVYLKRKNLHDSLKNMNYFFFHVCV